MGLIGDFASVLGNLIAPVLANNNSVVKLVNYLQ